MFQKRLSSFLIASILAFTMIFGMIPTVANADEMQASAQGTTFKEMAASEALEVGLAEIEAEEKAKVTVDASSISSFAPDGTSEGTYIIAAKDSTGAYYALTKDMVYQSEVPDPETDSAYSFGKAEPIDVITNDSGAVTGVKANGEKIDNLKWTCSYEENDYYFWTSAKTGSRKQLFISSEPKGGIKIYPQLRSVKYSGNVMSATAKTGINYVFFKDTPDSYGLQFTGVLKEDGQEPDASYNTSIYLFKVAGDTPEPVKFTSVDVTPTSSFEADGKSAGTYFVAAKDSLGRYYALTKDMVHQPAVPDPETDSADSFGFAEPIELVVEKGIVTQVKADSKKVEDLKWFCTYDSSEYYFWTSKDTSTRKQMFISSDPKGGIKIYPETRSVKYSDNVMSAKAKTGINYVIFKDAPDYYGLQFSGVLKEDGQKPDASYNTSIYLFKVAGSDPESAVETARKNATTQIDAAQSAANLGKYDTAEKAKINDLAKQYKDSISKAATAEEINKILGEFKAELSKIQTLQEKKAAATKKLKKGKKYKIKVRGYKTIDGKKVYGKFSKTKTTGKIK